MTTPFPTIFIPHLSPARTEPETLAPCSIQNPASSAVTREPVNDPESEVCQLVDVILERYPLAAPTHLLFVGSEPGQQVDLICSQVAHELTSRQTGKVLLLDANPAGVLTRNDCQFGLPGITDAIHRSANWQDVVSDWPTENLDFIPLGKASWDSWGGLERLRVATAEMTRHYQFVCTSAGEFRNTSAKIWSGLCDGSFLVVSQQYSNWTIAKTAVSQLKKDGARPLGCVVTDAA